MCQRVVELEGDLGSVCIYGLCRTPGFHSEYCVGWEEQVMGNGKSIFNF